MINRKIVDTKIDIINSTGEKIFLQTFRHENNKKAIVYFHGIEGHCDWFAQTANILAENGCDVFAYDRLGCGLSDGVRGHIESYKQLILDLKIIIDYVKDNYTYTNIGYFASCWGAKLALMAISGLDFKPGFIVLTSPAIFTQIDITFVEKFKILYFFILNKNLELVKLPILTSMLTNNEKFFDYLDNDKYRNRFITIRALIENLKISYLAIKSAKHVKMPILICLSQNDKIIDKDKLLNWVSKINSLNKDVKIFNSNSHCLDFDVDMNYKDYTQYLINWLNKIV